MRLGKSPGTATVRLGGKIDIIPHLAIGVVDITKPYSPVAAVKVVGDLGLNAANACEIMSDRLANVDIGGTTLSECSSLITLESRLQT